MIENFKAKPALTTARLRISGKNMQKDESPCIGNCPHCTKIIFKEAVFNSEASFSMRCPHCNKSVKVIIKHKIEIILIALHDQGKPKNTGPGPGMVVMIMALYLPHALYRLAGNVDIVRDLLT